MIFMRKTINFGERNQPKQMERYTMLTDRKKKNIEISVLPIFFFYRFNQIPTKIPSSHFVYISKIILKFV